MSLHALTPIVSSAHAKKAPVTTSLFDFFKQGPGPSSSHTIGPMKAAKDFLDMCKALPTSVKQSAVRIHTSLLGSLSATGLGHGTASAIMAGFLGHEPHKCPAGLLAQLHNTTGTTYSIDLEGHCVPLTLHDITYDSLVHDKPYSNTLICTLLDAQGTGLCQREYYSVGGGFIQWKGWTAPERGAPAYPYASMRELRAQLERTGLTLHELILDNESAITGQSRPHIFAQLEEVMEAMYDSVRRGLATEGVLPGTLGVHRKAKVILESANKVPHAVDRFMGRVNAYAFAAAEENAGGGVIVTAPTCGSAGVMPSILYALRYDLNIGGRALREGVLASAAIGYLAKHNAGIAGAEVGCQGEVGVASAMAAAMLTHARGNAIGVVENAAEIALEHHLGLTCDPVGGYVQIPCIERNAVGAIKAYNACLLARCESGVHHMVTLDAVIRAMGETGAEMNAKYKETSEGGLAVCMVDC